MDDVGCALTFTHGAVAGGGLPVQGPASKLKRKKNTTKKVYKFSCSLSRGRLKMLAC
jgi:hypothetical protein